jgi:hypothetical protein
MNGNEPLSAIDNKNTFGAFAVVTGVLSILFILESLRPLPAPAERLAFFLSHRGDFLLLAMLVLIWAVFSIPFVVALGAVLRPRGHGLSQAGTILSAIGISLLAFGTFTYVGAMLSITAVAHSPNPGDEAYQAAIWSNLSFFLSDPGLMTWGLGLLLFGRLAWKSDVLPDWLAIVGIVGGLAGLLTLVVYQTPILALLQFACFAVWGIAAGVLMIRSQRS